MNVQTTLVVQGGGFRTAFTAGVLDAFMLSDHYPFQRMIGVSGGALALSYYLSGQYRMCYEAMKHLSKDPEFMDWKRILSPAGYMNIEYLKQMADGEYYFDLKNAHRKQEDREVYFVATNKSSGQAEYLQPEPQNWVDCVIASSTLPFVTKGTHELENLELMDGGWSDPIPVRKAIDMGTEEVVIIRTRPRDEQISQSWLDYFGGLYFRENQELSHCFKSNYDAYNDAIELMNNPPENITLHQIAPKKFLESSTYSYSGKSLGNDYRYGLDMGLQFLMRRKLKAEARSDVYHAQRKSA